MCARPELPEPRLLEHVVALSITCQHQLELHQHHEDLCLSGELDVQIHVSHRSTIIRNTGSISISDVIVDENLACHRQH